MQRKVYENELNVNNENCSLCSDSREKGEASNVNTYHQWHAAHLFRVQMQSRSKTSLCVLWQRREQYRLERGPWQFKFSRGEGWEIDNTSTWTKTIWPLFRLRVYIYVQGRIPLIVGISFAYRSYIHSTPIKSVLEIKIQWLMIDIFWSILISSNRDLLFSTCLFLLLTLDLPYPSLIFKLLFYALRQVTVGIVPQNLAVCGSKNIQ